MTEETLVCRCSEVTVREVRDAIRAGAGDVDTVKRWTRAGMGLCQGKTCGPLVRRILSEELGRPLSTIRPGTVRPPVRPVPMSRLDVE
jgi:NAD(P)H-nitrite reductase large subunit